MHINATKGTLFVGSALAMIMAAGPGLAEPGYISGRVSLRAGPGVRYPVVANLRSGEAVDILGCMPRWGWCDIETRGLRGWAPGQSLQVIYENRRSSVIRFGRGVNIPFINFGVNEYWGEHYRGNSFYNQMPRFGGQPSPEQQPSGYPTPRPRAAAPRVDPPRGSIPGSSNPVGLAPSRGQAPVAPAVERQQPAARPDAPRAVAPNPREAAPPAAARDAGGRPPAAARNPQGDGRVRDQPAGRGQGEGESNDRGPRGER